MRPQIGVMGQLFTKNVLDDLNFAVENGFQWFEIALDWEQNYAFSAKTVSEIKKISSKSDIRLIVHTPFYLPTSSMVPEIKKALLAYSKKAILLAEKLGSDRMTIHPGYREMPQPAINLCYESLAENLSAIVKVAKKSSVAVCLENFDNGRAYLCYEQKDHLRLLSSVSDLKATFDAGHANTTQTKPADYFAAIKDFVLDMHVHDNNGQSDEHKCLGEGNIDFGALFAECKAAGYVGPFVLELFPFENLLRGKNIFLDLWNRE